MEIANKTAAGAPRLLCSRKELELVALSCRNGEIYGGELEGDHLN